MCGFQNLTRFIIRRQRSPRTLQQPLRVSKQIVQMLIGREDGRVEPKADVEDRLLVVDPLDVRS